jgi:hypothetical protein
MRRLAGARCDGRFQISKVTNVKAVLRNLHHRSAPPANCSPLYLAPFAGGGSVILGSLKTLVNLASFWKSTKIFVLQKYSYYERIGVLNN